MAATSATQFLDIPAGTSGAQLVELINDRLRAITQALNTSGSSPVTGDLNMNGYRVVVLGNPLNPQDALNLRTADKRYSPLAAGQSPAAQSTAVQSPAAQVASSATTLILTVPGTLAIESNAAPLVQFTAARSFTKIALFVKQAPAGAAITVSVNAGSKVLGMAAIAAGAVSGTATVSWTLPANSLLTVDITGVGLSFPGADLTIELS